MTRWRMWSLPGNARRSKRASTGSLRLPGSSRQAMKAPPSRHGIRAYHESPPQALGGDPAYHSGGGSDKGAQRPEGIAQTVQRLVPVESFTARRRRLPPREPRLEMHVPDLQPALRPMTLGVDASNELAVMEDGQGVIAVHALVAGRVDLDAVVEAEQTRHAAAIPQERIEGRQERCPRRRRG